MIEQLAMELKLQRNKILLKRKLHKLVNVKKQEVFKLLNISLKSLVSFNWVLQVYL